MASSPLKRTATDAEFDFTPLNPEATEPQPSHNSKHGDQETVSDATSKLESATHETDKSPATNPSNIDPPPQNTVTPPVSSKMGGTSSSTNPTKRRKLTFAEKEAQKVEKAHKELQKKEELAKKEEEKAKKEQEKKAREEEKRAKEELKESERRKKEEEKEEKRKAKEAEKAAKDEEKRRKDAEKKAKEDEKSKKDRNQLRLKSFFTNPKPFSQGPDSPLQGENLIPSRRNSVASASIGGSKANSRASSVCPEPRKSDWERCFPPFFLHAHTTLAPYNRHRKGKKRQSSEQVVTEELDCLLKGGEGAVTIRNTKTLIPMSTRSKPPLAPLPPTRDIIARINGTPAHPIDLTKSSSDPSPLLLLRALPVKYLKYYEDVRPPYIGTFTRRPGSSRSYSKICRRPCTSRDLSGINYDYDSEAEWEEPGEGEDLDSEGDLDDEGDDEADDMEGFLDDEGAEQARKRIFGGDMVPTQTAICWEDGKKGKKEVDFGEGKLDLKTLSIEGLLADLAFPIDPYSMAYWPSTVPTTTTASSSITTQPNANPRISPSQSRLPLNTVSTSASNLPFPHLAQQSHNPSKLSSAPLTNNPSAAASPLVAIVGKPPKKPFPSELLPELKKAVEGSDLTKAGLVEILKKRFPKVGKDAIHYTLGLIAERVGKSESEKRWVLR